MAPIHGVMDKTLGLNFGVGLNSGKDAIYFKSTILSVKNVCNYHLRRLGQNSVMFLGSCVKPYQGLQPPCIAWLHWGSKYGIQ